MGRRSANHRVHQREALQILRGSRPWDKYVKLPLLILPVLITLVWSYWPVLADLFHTWQKSDDYSAGQLVPLAALFFLWREKKRLGQCVLAPSWWSGTVLIVSAQLVRTYGFLFMRSAAERYSLVIMMAGLVLMVAGREVFRRVVWIILFLFLMFPLSGVMHNLIAGPLQRLATTGSVVFLEASGVSVSQQGNVILLNENTPIAVAEACSGLRMLTAFIIVTVFIAYMVKRPPWQKVALLVSSIPVAVVCNVLRIVATAILVLYVSVEGAEKFFHDFAGYVMMPAAVALLFGEIRLMDRVIVPDDAPSPSRRMVTRSRPVRKSRASRATGM